MRHRMKRAAVAAMSVLSVLAVTGCSALGGTTDTVDVVGYSVLKSSNAEIFEVYNETEDGDVSFRTSYGASGDQSRAVEGGQSADWVHLSLETDVQRLVDAGKVAEDWKDTPTQGILTSSVVVFVVREGNPENIRTWEDLIESGIEVVTPNPASSGSARWNILAGWGSVIAQGGTPAEAKAYTRKLLSHTINLPASGREATSAFVDGGQGDVLLSYENEAILAKQQGQEVDYVIPPQTLLIENPGALLENAGEDAKDVFEFLHTKKAQRIYAESGFRPVGVEIPGLEVDGVNDSDHPYPEPKQLLTIDEDFGGWAEAAPKFFDEEDGIITRLLAEVGAEGS